MKTRRAAASLQIHLPRMNNEGTCSVSSSYSFPPHAPGIHWFYVVLRSEPPAQERWRVQGQCCQVRTVSGAGGELDGEYRLLATPPAKPHPLCADTCVYSRAGDQDPDNTFCFQEVDLQEAAAVECLASSTVPYSASAEASTVTETVSTSQPNTVGKDHQ